MTTKRNATTLERWRAVESSRHTGGAQLQGRRDKACDWCQHTLVPRTQALTYLQKILEHFLCKPLLLRD